MSTIKTTTFQHVLRILLGLFMIVAGVGHLSFQRQAFQAQVPDWIPLSKDLVVILSGVVEITLGAAMLFWKKYRVETGIALAIFYLLVFPGNIAQYINGVDAFGLDTDQKRLTRLFFQPILILWALYSTGVWSWLRREKK